MERVSLAEKFGKIRDHWVPKIVAQVDDHWVKLVKVKDEFLWHRHPDGDELFLVVRGRIRIERKDGAVDLEEGELAVVPKGVEHRPVAEDEAHVVLIERSSVVNTGTEASDRTVEPEWV